MQLPDLITNNFYFFGVLLILPIWILLFSRKTSRNELLLMGTIFGILGIFAGKFYATKDYWSPTYILGPSLNIEDFMYGFLFGIIVTELGEFILGYKDSRSKTQKVKKNFTLVLLAILITALSVYILVDVLHFNSITAHIIPPLIGGFIVLHLRRDLTKVILFRLWRL